MSAKHICRPDRKRKAAPTEEAGINTKTLIALLEELPRHIWQVVDVQAMLRNAKSPPKGLKMPGQVPSRDTKPVNLLVPEHLPVLSAASDEVSAFWGQLRNAKIDDNGILNFLSINPLVYPEETKLLVKKDYEQLWSLMQESIEINDSNKSPPRANRFIITGVPGIGKSVFLFYLLWLLSKDDVARAAGIIYTDSTGYYHIFNDKGAFVTKASSEFLKRTVANKGAWWLMDGEEQGHFISAKCKLVLAASSPMKSNYRKLEKHSARRLDFGYLCGT